MAAPTLVPPPVAPGATGSAPERPPAASGLSPWRAVAAVLSALLLAALLNPDDLLHRARVMPFGWQRDAAVAVAEANRDVSRALWLDRPRRAVDRLFDRDTGTSPGPAVVAPVGRSRTGAQITAAAPLRVYLGGDSVAQAIARSFDAAATDTGLIDPTVEFRFATGLTRSDYFDWPGHLRSVVVARPAPELVIVMFGANDVQAIMTPTGAARPGTDAWLAEYRRRVDAVMNQLAASKVPVLWLGQPVMRSAAFDRRIRELDGVFAAAAAAHPTVTYLDTRPLLAGRDGGYAAYLPGPDGRPVLVRSADGVHLAPAGADRVTAAILAFIRDRWHLTG